MEFKILPKLLKKREEIFYHLKNYITTKIIKNLNFKKVIGINLSFFMINYFLLHKDNLSKNKMFNSTKNEFDFLLNYNPNEKSKFTNKKCPKILYLRGLLENEKNKNLIEGNFEKIYSKYKDLESFQFDLRRNLNGVNELEKLLKEYGYTIKDLIEDNLEINENNLGKIKEELLKKPFLFLNKYGDVRSYNLDQFNEIAKSDAVYNYFEKLSILNNKHDLLILNDYDYAFVIYLDSKNLDYSLNIFKIYRRMHFVTNFFNIKFFVATPEHSTFLNEMNLELNNVYLFKRENMLNKLNTNNNKFDLEKENFEMFNLTKDLINIKSDFKIDDNEFSKNLNKTLLLKTNFVYYANHPFKMKQGLEIFNLYFKDIPYYLYFTNLKVEENREKLNEIIETFRDNVNLINDNFAFVVVDNEKTNRNALFKSFHQKTFNLTESTLKNAKFEEKISHYEPSVTKKLKLTELTKEKIKELIKKEDISIDENYVFNKKIHPENFRMTNHLQLDYHLNKNSKKANVILIRNKDEKYNRNSKKRIENLAHMNKNIEFYYIYNTEKNLEHLNKKFGNIFGEVKNYPQLLIIKEDKINLMPVDIFLKYSNNDESINEELKKILI